MPLQLNRQGGLHPAPLVALAVALVAAVASAAYAVGAQQRRKEEDDAEHIERSSVAPKQSQPKKATAAPKPVRTEATAAPKQRVRDKASERLEWWQRLNEVKPILTIPERQASPLAADLLKAVAEAMPEAEKVHQEVAQVAQDRLSRGRDWLVRDSDYPADGSVPAHAGVKAQVNRALVEAMTELFGDSLADLLGADSRKIFLLLDTPQYGTLTNMVRSFPRLRCCQQVVIPQADLSHYFEMTRSADFYPGIRAQRLDHWLCANHRLGLQSLVSFLDYECRLVGSMSARLCPAADIMRYFRFGYPAEPVSLLALTVGLEDPAPTPETVDAFVRWEAALNGYATELRAVWKYRMVTLLYVVRRAASPTVSDSG